MQVKYLLIGLILLSGFLGYGQNRSYNQRREFLKGNSHWAMPGDNAGLDFSTGSPVAVRTSMVGWEGGAAVSDPVTGKLLFYSNGEECWNVNGARMLHGDSLLGNSRYSALQSSLPISFLTTMQGVCIIPVLAEPGKYYLFSLVGKSSPVADYSRGALFYSVVDMKLNNGLGDIERGRKNIPLCRDTLSEMMIAIPGDCGDIWLLVHRYGKEDFLTYHITKDGIDSTPVISNIETSLPSAYGPLFNLMGYFQAYAAKSPDRKKVAIATVMLFLICEFDPQTGKVANPIEVPALSGPTLGSEPCFSPDNSKLYISNADSIFQLNIGVYDSLSINRSVKGVAVNTSIDSSSLKFGRSYANMRLYNDSVYVWFYDQYSRYNRYISRINRPNLDGDACGFEQRAVPIHEGTTIVFGLGNEAVFPLPPDTSYSPPTDIATCGQEVLLTPGTLYENTRWNDGSTEKSLNVHSDGVYWVIQNDACAAYVDTFNVTFWDAPDPVINVQERRLGTTRNYLTYQWMWNGTLIPNATDSVYIVQDGGNGDYQVIVSNEHCTDTSGIYVVTNAGEPTAGFPADDVHIFPNPSKDIVSILYTGKVNILIASLEGKVLKKENGINQFSVKDLTAGIYFLHVYDRKDRIKVIKFTKTE